MALETPIDIFDTPELRYGKLRREFDKKYLNPKAWNHECDTKEIVQAYHDLLEFLERTESFRDLTEGLKTDIPVDNVHLVLDDLPFTQKQREDLIAGFPIHFSARGGMVPPLGGGLGQVGGGNAA